MGDDLTDMGMFQPRAPFGQRWGDKQVVLAQITRSTRLRETRMPRQTRSRAQTSWRCPSPSQLGMASRSASLADQQRRIVRRSRCFDPRRFAWWALSGGLLPGFRWRRTRNWAKLSQAALDPLEAVGQSPCRERWRHSSPLTSGPPQRAGRLRLGLQQFAPAGGDQLPDPLHGGRSDQFRLHADRPLRSCEASDVTGDRLISRHCSSRKISTPNCRDKSPSALGSPRKSRRATSRLRRHRPPGWPSPSKACRRGPWPNVDEPSSPSFTTGPSTASTLFSKLPVMFRSSLDTSIKGQFCVQGNRVRLKSTSDHPSASESCSPYPPQQRGERQK